MKIRSFSGFDTVLSGRSIPAASIISVYLVMDDAITSNVAARFYQTIRHQIAQYIRFYF
jgi:hypothetical protein